MHISLALLRVVKWEHTHLVQKTKPKVTGQGLATGQTIKVLAMPSRGKIGLSLPY